MEPAMTRLNMNVSKSIRKVSYSKKYVKEYTRRIWSYTGVFYVISEQCEKVVFYVW